MRQFVNFKTYSRVLSAIFVLTFLFISEQTFAQNSVGIGTTTPDPNAVLDLQSPTNNQGLLVPRLTTAQRIGMGLAVAQNGLMVYDIDESAFYYWNASVLAWEEIGSPGTDDDWVINADTIYNNTHWVAIGTNSPLSYIRLTVSNGGLRSAIGGYSTGNGQYAIGVEGYAEGATDANIGVYGGTKSNSVNDTVAGVLGEANEIQYIGVGVRGAAVGAGGVAGAQVIGGSFKAGDEGANSLIGVEGNANGGGTSTQSIGIYGTANGATTNYAGFFADGDVFIQNNVGIGISSPTTKLHVVGNFRLVDGTQAAGRILTSDGFGNATWQDAAVGNAWELMGNAGTVDGTNFIGTTDNVPFNIRVNNIKAGKISTTETSFGYQSLLNNSGNNTAFGHYSATNNTTGTYNTSMGYLSLYSNLTSNYNTAIGYNSLSSNTAPNNTALGANSAQNNTSGQYNTAIGTNSLRLNVSGNFNTGTGDRVLYSNTGSSNSAYGYLSSYNNTIGASNTSFGSTSMYNNVAGSRATAIGTRAMYYTNNTTTAYINTNVALGYEAFRGSTTASNNTGLNNTAIGYSSSLNNSTGASNTAVGYESNYANSAGNLNTAIGSRALYNNTA